MVCIWKNCVPGGALAELIVFSITENVLLVSMNSGWYPLLLRLERFSLVTSAVTSKLNEIGVILGGTLRAAGVFESCCYRIIKIEK